MDLYVSILCTRGFTCTINIKTIYQYIMYSWIYMYNKHRILCTPGFTCTINIKTICQYLMYSWIYMYNKHQSNMSVYYVLVDLYVSILCTRGFTCTINIKTICQYIMYSTRGFICQYIMYSWIYMYNKHQNNISVYYVLCVFSG